MPLPPALGRINMMVTNRVAGAVAGRLPGFGIITHRGRRSGRTYHTPVNVFRRPGGYILALTYGQGDWVKNVLASGDAQIRSRGRTYHVENPRVVNNRTRSGVPLPVRRILGVLNVDDFLLMDDSAGGSSSSSSSMEDGQTCATGAAWAARIRSKRPQVGTTG